MDFHESDAVLRRRVRPFATDGERWSAGRSVCLSESPAKTAELIEMRVPFRIPVSQKQQTTSLEVIKAIYRKPIYRPPRLRSWSSAFHRVHYPPQHSHLLPFPQPSPLCRRHPAVFLILPAQLRLKHHPPAKCTSANLYLDDCQSPNSQFLQD